MAGWRPYPGQQKTGEVGCFGPQVDYHWLPVATGSETGGITVLIVNYIDVAIFAGMATINMDLLLADDDTDDCSFFKDALSDLPVTTTLVTVHNGVELMKLLTQKAFKLPHALYLDLNMPRKNGFECLAEIKLNETLKHLPVVIFSTSLDKEVVDSLYVQGANYYIRKPAEFSVLKKVILKSITLIKENKDRQATKEEFVISF